MDDDQIIELYFSRDEQAIRETQNKYGQLCIGIAQKILSRREDAEECVNDAYLCLWDQIPPLRPQHLPAYLCKIVRNLSLKRMQYNNAEKRSEKMTVSLEELECIIPAAPVQDDLWLREKINAYLHSEKPQNRKVFIRRYFFFDSIAGIAAMYSLNENKVKSILFRCRNRLQAYLEKEGISK